MKVAEYTWNILDMVNGTGVWYQVTHFFIPDHIAAGLLLCNDGDESIVNEAATRITIVT